jgi:pimeloyl-ACP methyl ester carboxylesterase
MRCNGNPLLVPLAILLGLSLVHGCHANHGGISNGGFTVPGLDSCRVEPDHHYYISLPDHIQPGQALPLVIIIDPHGDGLTALQKFRGALEGLPLVLVGSAKLKNNYEGFEASLNYLNQDVLGKYPVDPQSVIVAGFSGGARMAFYYGLKNPVKGIIMFGAGPGQLPAGLQGKQLYAVSGTRDFNFVEQYRPLFSGIPNTTGYLNDYFRGIHAWPPERYIREAVVFCLKVDNEPFHHISHDLSGEFLDEFDSLRNANDQFFAGKALEKAWYFATRPVQQKQLLEKINKFEHQAAWFTCQKEFEAYLTKENRVKQMFAENLADPDMAWWNAELDTLFTKISTSGEPVETDYYYRLKGFLGIYLYSRLNQLLMGGNTTNLTDRLLEIYARVEPQSEDLVRFTSELSRLRESKSAPSKSH